MKHQTPLNFRGSCKGFTLVEIAISLIILGVFIAPLFVLYNQYEKEKRIETTYVNVNDAMNRLQLYLQANGDLPCPAPITYSRTVGENDTVARPAGSTAKTLYGRPHPIACTITDPPSGSTVPLGTTIPEYDFGNCTDGICVLQSKRSNDPTTGVTGDQRRVIVGALPFRELQMQEKQAIDGYGNRLLYAVTKTMTDERTMNIQKGSISVEDPTTTPPTSLVTPNDSVAFLVLSLGEDEAGAINQNGIVVEPCKANAETENCDFPPVNQNAVFVSAFKSDVDDPNYFDDVIMYFAGNEVPTWAKIPNTEDIIDLAAGPAGVGTKNPKVELEVTARPSATDAANVWTAGEDAIRAEGPEPDDGTVFVDEICDENGANCFDVKVLAGDPLDTSIIDPEDRGGMKCPDDEFMVGIEATGPKCISLAQLEVKCGVGQVFIGFEQNGNIKCIDIPTGSCPGGPIPNPCGGSDFDRPGLGNNLSWSSPTVGTPGGQGCYKETWECTGGTWRAINPLTPEQTASLCSFTPFIDIDVACAPGKQTKTTTTTLCGGGQDIKTEVIDIPDTPLACGCDPRVVQKNANCVDAQAIFGTDVGKYFDGTFTYNEIYECVYKIDPDTGLPSTTPTLSTTPRNEIPSDLSTQCKCAPPATADTFACAAGTSQYSGTCRKQTKTCDYLGAPNNKPGYNPVEGNKPYALQEWNSATCGWVDIGKGGACECGLKDVPQRTPPKCWTDASAKEQECMTYTENVDYYRANKATCTIEPNIDENHPDKVIGRCDDVDYVWEQLGTNSLGGSKFPGPGAIFVGDRNKAGCSCGERKNKSDLLKKNCFQRGGNQIYSCYCKPTTN